VRVRPPLVAVSPSVPEAPRDADAEVAASEYEMKGGQYPDPHDERTSAQLRAELEVLEAKARASSFNRVTATKIRDIRFELLRRKQNGIDK
jgi:hypothetical protein